MTDTLSRPSKSEAIATLQRIGEYARKAAVLFGDLRSRCGMLEAATRHNTNDPLSDEQLMHFKKLISDWEAAAQDLSKEPL